MNSQPGRIIYGIGWVLFLVLAGCVTDSSRWDPTDYSVRSGDSLYSIAWRYELDPSDLARWNDLNDTSLIHPGQRLHTRAPMGPYGQPIVETSVANAPAQDNDFGTSVSAIVVDRGDTLYGLARKYRVDVKQLISVNRLRPPYLLHPGQTLYTQSESAVTLTIPDVSPVTQPTAPTSPISQPLESTTSYPSVVKWSWPLKGKLIASFNSRRSDAKGIDISAREGADVRAAAMGRVVYSGNGLISFGNLVIIKHNEDYLSAYAYNRKLLVAEGEMVKAGQVIAEVGKSDTNKPVLHFEIRKHGKPVDPVRYLPRG